ncbi:MAG: thiamine pyrophosphate-dependent dehydrogenase E1 component subunit alpha [Chloroflexi bacterium]|nr:MAG: thiamine pyrophosphate-dependent dehydrogenase E1 component subunit alpha [Chloroflexota bacterium]
MSLIADDTLYQVLSPTGEVVGSVPAIAPAGHLNLYRWMVFGRVFSDRMTALQRQGRMGTFAEVKGQEAACVGLAARLTEEDWLMGSYRESLAYMVKGVPLAAQLKHWGGYIPDNYPFEARCLPFQIVLATQVLHAVGIAHAIKYKGEPHVAVVGIGDGATSEGDFNEALNAAAVFELPVIFVVQNNGWAISVPRHAQTRVDSFVRRAAGFAVPGLRVDGNDILAMIGAMDTALDRARSGGGPTLIEAETYRMGAHTTADDPTRYRPPEDLELWGRRDPIIRYRKFLMDRQLLTDLEDEQLQDDVTAEFEAAVAEFEALPPQDVAQHFDLILGNPPPQLARQKAQILNEQ